MCPENEHSKKDEGSVKPHSDISINRAMHLAVIRRYGEMSLEQLIDGVDVLFSTPDFDDTTNIVSDLSHASLEVTGEEMREHAEYCKKILGGSSNRLAIIAPDAVDFGLSRMFEIISGAIAMNPCGRSGWVGDLIR
jgi:hypothetical protein